jgi:hypothetical protein
LRTLENSDFTTEVTVDKGEGVINVEAVDDQGNYKNFLNLQAIVVSPKGETRTNLLEQTGPGHYEARFATKEVGLYMLNLMDRKDGRSQVIGASVNYSPEFAASEPNHNLLRRIAETAGGKVLDPKDTSINPFLHDRQKTFQPRDLWEWLLKFAVILFTLDVGVRRIQIDHDEWLRATRTLRRWIFFWQGVPRTPEAEESLSALLTRRDQVRSKQTAPATTAPSPDLFKPERPVTEVLPGEASALAAPKPGEGGSTPSPDEKKAPEPEEKPTTTTTSRLLEAKRRAAQRRKP